MNRDKGTPNERAAAARKPFTPPLLRPTSTSEASAPDGAEARSPFEPPALTRHESLPVITAGSVDLWSS